MTGITQNVGISIHAPAKGATARTGKDFFRYGYFNPRSREGSDVCRFSSLSRQNDFNPRSREGSDRGAPLTRRTRWHFNPRSREGSDCCMSPTFQRSKISIHAPAKGATQMAVPFLYRQRHFNPRSREGSDATSACAVYGMRYFNPRSREGSDISELHFPRNLLRISIHAPAKGATLKLQRP